MADNTNLRNLADLLGLDIRNLKSRLESVESTKANKNDFQYILNALSDNKSSDNSEIINKIISKINELKASRGEANSSESTTNNLEGLAKILGLDIGELRAGVNSVESIKADKNDFQHILNALDSNSSNDDSDIITKIVAKINELKASKPIASSSDDCQLAVNLKLGGHVGDLFSDIRLNTDSLFTTDPSNPKLFRLTNYPTVNAGFPSIGYYYYTLSGLDTTYIAKNSQLDITIPDSSIVVSDRHSSAMMYLVYEPKVPSDDFIKGLITRAISAEVASNGLKDMSVDVMSFRRPSGMSDADYVSLIESYLYILDIISEYSKDSSLHIRTVPRLSILESEILGMIHRPMNLKLRHVKIDDNRLYYLDVRSASTIYDSISLLADDCYYASSNSTTASGRIELDSSYYQPNRLKHLHLANLLGDGLDLSRALNTNSDGQYPLINLKDIIISADYSALSDIFDISSELYRNYEAILRDGPRSYLPNISKIYYPKVMIDKLPEELKGLDVLDYSDYRVDNSNLSDVSLNIPTYRKYFNSDFTLGYELEDYADDIILISKSGDKYDKYKFDKSSLVRGKSGLNSPQKAGDDSYYTIDSSISNNELRFGDNKSKFSTGFDIKYIIPRSMTTLNNITKDGFHINTNDYSVSESLLISKSRISKVVATLELSDIINLDYEGSDWFINDKGLLESGDKFKGSNSHDMFTVTDLVVPEGVELECRSKLIHDSNKSYGDRGYLKFIRLDSYDENNRDAYYAYSQYENKSDDEVTNRIEPGIYKVILGYYKSGYQPQGGDRVILDYCHFTVVSKS